MPRREVPFLPGHYYHIYNRGNNRQAIFFDRENYVYFLRGMKAFLCKYLEILVYCLMPTHYHLLVRVRPLQTSEVLEGSGSDTSRQVSLAMQKFLISYTKAINKRYERVGALFQGQFQAKLVQQDDHLMHLCAYIHANPVKDNLVSVPEAWEFSNYLEWMNLRQGTLFDHAFARDMFGSCEEYGKFVKAFVENQNAPAEAGKYLLGFED